MTDHAGMSGRPGRAFQAETGYTRDTMEDRQLDWRTKPAAYKFYPHVPVISLPKPATDPEEEQLDLWKCVARRRSVRTYAQTPLTMMELSRLLWASSGITANFGQEFYRAAPSAGALYPIETYVVVNHVGDLEPGLYHYRVAGVDILERAIVEGSHSLEQLKTADLGKEIAGAALDQPMCRKAGAVFIWTAVFERSVWKYRERAYRYAYLDAGHIAAQLALAAVALGLGSCQVAAFFDDEANRLLDIDGENEAVLYMTSVGRPSRPFGMGRRISSTSRPKE
jgi:SagB-type dehydrogenase family enzyme